MSVRRAVAYMTHLARVTDACKDLTTSPSSTGYVPGSIPCSGDDDDAEGTRKSDRRAGGPIDNRRCGCPDRRRSPGDDANRIPPGVPRPVQQLDVEVHRAG